MTDTPPLSETPSSETESSVDAAPPPPARRSPLRRLGCGIALVVWFLLLLTPCALFTLATQGQIAVRTGALEEQELRVFLQMDADNRGLVVSNGAVRTETETRLCIETHVSYVLWAGREDPSVYCTCYARTSSDAAWSYSESLMSVCPAP